MQKVFCFSENALHTNLDSFDSETWENSKSNKTESKNNNNRKYLERMFKPENSIVYVRIMVWLRAMQHIIYL